MIQFFFDGELLAELVLDGLQDSFPWYEGTLVEGPAMATWREFVRAYHDADIEFDYCPHHPDEGPFEETDIAEYLKLLKALYAARVAGHPPPDAEPAHWLTPWRNQPVEQLAGYIAFLDWRRWRVVNREGELVVGIALPPSLDLDSKRFAFRP